MFGSVQTNINISYVRNSVININNGIFVFIILYAFLQL